MGRGVLPPEQADSWDEFRARVELERAAREGPVPVLCRAAAALLFVSGRILIADALEGGRPWLWPCAVALLAIVGMMADRALSNAERRASRAAELDLIEQAWQARAGHCSPTL